MQQQLEGLVHNLAGLHSIESTSDQRKAASQWLQAWQKEPDAAKTAFSILTGAPEQTSTPTPASPLNNATDQSHVSSRSVSAASSLSHADEQVHLYMFCAQTISNRLKQVLMKPAELRQKAVEEWMAPQIVTELSTRLRSYDHLKGVLATCLGHSVVIRLCISQEGLSEVLEAMLKGLQDCYSLALNAIKQGATENAIRLLSAPHDNFAMIRAIADSLKFVSSDPEGRLRHLALKLASMLWNEDLVELIEISAGQACSHPALFQLATNSVMDVIQVVEDYNKAWSGFVLNLFLGPRDYQMIVETYPTFARLQARIIKFALLAPTVLVAQGSHTQITGFRELSVLQASATVITGPINSTIKQLSNFLKIRGTALKPPFQELVESPKYVLYSAMFMMNTALDLCLPLKELAEYRQLTLQYARSVNGLNVKGSFTETWQKFLENDERQNQLQKDVLDKTLNMFLADSQSEWWRMARSDPKSSTPQELLYGDTGFMHTSDLSSDDEGDMMSDIDGAGFGDMSISAWQKVEWNYSYSLATYVVWLGNLIHCFGPLFAFGCVCDSFDGDLTASTAYYKLFMRAANIPEAPGLNLADAPKLEIPRIKELCHVALLLGLPDYSVCTEESLVVVEHSISSSFLMTLDSGVKLKRFEVDRCIALNENSKLNYEYTFSTLNDAINNSLRDYALTFVAALDTDGFLDRFRNAHNALLEPIMFRSAATLCYPLNFDGLEARLKKWFIEHRDEVRRNLKCWIAVLNNKRADCVRELADRTMAKLSAQSTGSWRSFEIISQLLVSLSLTDPSVYIKYLGDPTLIAKAREHRAVLRQYLTFMAACSKDLANSKAEFLQSSLIMCRASLRIPQADRSYPLSSMQDHIGVISLAKIINNLAKNIPDADLPTILTLHKDTVFLMQDATERACGVALQEKSRGHCCWVSMHSFTSLLFCCGRYLACGSPPPQQFNDIVIHMVEQLVELAVKSVDLLKDAPPPLPIAEVPTGQRVLSFLIRDLVLSLAIYVSEILPPGLGCLTNILRSTGFVTSELNAFGNKTSATADAMEIAHARCERLCAHLPNLIMTAAPIVTDRPAISDAFALLLEAVLGSGLVEDMNIIQPVVNAVSSSPLLASLEHYLKALRVSKPELIASGIAKLDGLIAERLNDCLSLSRCSLARSNELAIMTLALTRFFRLRHSLFQDVPFALGQADLLMTAAFGVSLLAVLSYTHFMFCNPQSDQISCPTEALELIADLLEKGLGNRDISSLGAGFLQGVHNLVSDTQLKAATKGSAKSRESVTPSVPSPAPLLQNVTPTSPSTELQARTAATVALMTMISAQDSCSAATIVELHRSVDLAPRILDTASVNAAARYLARALPFDTTGAAISAAPYKWAASEESIEMFVEAVRNASSIRKTLRNHCALLNVAKRRGSRVSSNLLAP